jgi:hypothetical protein
MSGDKSPLAELIGDLLERPSHEITVPIKKGVDATIAFWALTQREELEARKAAFEFIRDGIKLTAVELEWDEKRALNDAIMDEVLWRAMRNPKNKILPFAESPSEIRSRIGSQVIQGLFVEYLKWNREQAWLRNSEDPVGELDKLVDHVKKLRPVNSLLMHFDTPLLQDCLLIAIDRLANSPSDSSSDSSSSSE